MWENISQDRLPKFVKSEAWKIFNKFFLGMFTLFHVIVGFKALRECLGYFTMFLGSKQYNPVS